MTAGNAHGRRARAAFWTLVGTASLFMGLLSSSLAGKPGPLTGLLVAASGAVVLVAVALAARIMIAVDRARRDASHRSR